MDGNREWGQGKSVKNHERGEKSGLSMPRKAEWRVYAGI